MFALLLLAAAGSLALYAAGGDEGQGPLRFFEKNHWRFRWDSEGFVLLVEPSAGGPTHYVGEPMTLPEAEAMADAWVAVHGMGLEGGEAPPVNAGFQEKPQIQAVDGVVLNTFCTYDKPDEVWEEETTVGAGMTYVDVPIMNAYAGCSTPLKVKVCVRLSPPTNVAFLPGNAPPPTSWAIQFTLDIVGNADGNVRKVKVHSAKDWHCPGWSAVKAYGEVKSIKGRVVDGAAGIRIGIEPKHKWTKRATVLVDATS